MMGRSGVDSWPMAQRSPASTRRAWTLPGNRRLQRSFRRFLAGGDHDMIVTYLFVSPFVRYVVVKLSFIFWVMMGENGAGKSTLMKMITGIYQPDSGEMSFGGKPLSPKSYRESLAMGIDIVHQEIQAVTDDRLARNLILVHVFRWCGGGAEKHGRGLMEERGGLGVRWCLPS